MQPSRRIRNAIWVATGVCIVTLTGCSFGSTQDSKQNHTIETSKGEASTVAVASSNGASSSASRIVSPELAAEGGAPMGDSARLKFRAIVRDGNRNQVLHTGEAIAIEIEVRNEGPEFARAVDLSVTATPPLIEQIPGLIAVGDLSPGETKRVTVEGKAGMVKDAVQAELLLTLRAGFPSNPLPFSKKFVVAMKPESATEAIAQPVDVDQLPANTGMLEQPNAVAIVIGVGQYRDDRIARVTYAARDADTVATYFKAFGGIPPDRVRTFIDGNALKSDVNEVVEEWLPREADSSTVVYVFVTGRGVVDADTGAVSILVHDSTPTSGSRLYALRRLQDSLAKLPIRQAIVMLDLSFEQEAGKDIANLVAPLWEQEGRENDKIMWMVGNRSIQEAHSYDPGHHGLFAYQLLKGLRGAADLNQDGIVLASELCTYARGHVMEVAREQYLNEQEPLCIPGPGQEVSARMQPLAEFQ